MKCSKGAHLNDMLGEMGAAGVAVEPQVKLELW